MKPEYFEYLRETMKVLHRVRKVFDTDLDFAVAIVSVIFLVNDFKGWTEEEFIQKMTKLHEKTEENV